MPLFEILSLLVLLGVTWLWYDGTQAQARAIREVAANCAAEGLQLLDATVSISAMRLDRNDEGRLCIRRIYTFDYSDTGNNRRRGSIVMLGDTVELVNIGLRLVTSAHTVH